jgi:hypothetical protein
MTEAIKNLPVVEPDQGWFLDLGYRGGVAKRVGWWVIEGKYRSHRYVVVFNDGTRCPVREGTNPVERIKD